MPPPQMTKSQHATDDTACTICGCVCDDLTIHTRDGQITAADRACELAEPWFLQQDSAIELPLVRIRNQQAELVDGVSHAAEILRRAKAPLIYGLSRSSTPGQRAAVRLADQLGATIDTTASTCHAPSILALQVAGESTSTLGEVRNRANLIVYWGSNPIESHPRHIERIVDAPGMHIPGGRSDRTVVVIDVHRTATADIADHFYQVEPDSDFEVIWTLRSMLKHGDDSIENPVGGLSVAQLRELAQLLRSCNYGSVFFGLGLTKADVGHAPVEALLRLVTELNSHTRFVARRMRIPGDVAGADSVLCWQTGFPFSVNLAQGYPRYNPGEYTAGVVLERKEADAVLLVGSDGIEKLSDAARQHLQHIPTIVLDPPAAKCSFSADVHFTTAIYGVHRPGTAYRMDEVPIPLRAVLDSSLPSDDEVLAAISARCRGLNIDE